MDNALLELLERRLLAPGVALTTVTTVSDGGVRSRRCATWQQQEGTWRVRFRQGTPIAASPTGPI
ncbi:MAG: hypothetical protein R3E86_08720 [Pseudomonadales bacterium]